ncbi:hypothetical protein TNCV_952631 [Trichonephila clavipes]|nr:hypothetical protein TNCV_952631 [Trichonephila clavipes]
MKKLNIYSYLWPTERVCFFITTAIDYTRQEAPHKNMAEFGLGNFTSARSYTQVIAPSDYHMFHSLQDFIINENEYVKYEDTEMTVEEYFVSKTENFFSRGLNKLPKRWQTIVPNKGHPILD